MARIGNEARLILKLADERMIYCRAEYQRCIEKDDTALRLVGYDDARREYRLCLTAIVRELEDK